MRGWEEGWLHFRSNFTRRLDILPYLLVNHTGSVLSFATCVSGQKRGGNGRKLSAGRWISVKDGETHQFSFEADPWQPIEVRFRPWRSDGWGGRGDVLGGLCRPVLVASYRDPSGRLARDQTDSSGCCGNVFPTGEVGRFEEIVVGKHCLLDCGAEG